MCMTFGWGRHDERGGRFVGRNAHIKREAALCGGHCFIIVPVVALHPPGEWRLLLLLLLLYTLLRDAVDVRYPSRIVQDRRSALKNGAADARRRIARNNAVAVPLVLLWLAVLALALMLLVARTMVVAGAFGIVEHDLLLVDGERPFKNVGLHFSHLRPTSWIFVCYLPVPLLLFHPHSILKTSTAPRRRCLWRRVLFEIIVFVIVLKIVLVVFLHSPRNPR